MPSGPISGIVWLFFTWFLMTGSTHRTISQKWFIISKRAAGRTTRQILMTKPMDHSMVHFLGEICLGYDVMCCANRLTIGRAVIYWGSYLGQPYGTGVMDSRVVPSEGARALGIMIGRAISNQGRALSSSIPGTVGTIL